MINIVCVKYDQHSFTLLQHFFWLDFSRLSNTKVCCSFTSEFLDTFYHCFYCKCFIYFSVVKVLIIGGGDGGVAREVAKHPSVESVVKFQGGGSQNFGSFMRIFTVYKTEKFCTWCRIIYSDCFPSC